MDRRVVWVRTLAKLARQPCRQVGKKGYKANVYRHDVLQVTHLCEACMTVVSSDM